MVLRNNKRRRRRRGWRQWLPTSYNLRSLFVVMLLASVVVFWWNDRRQLEERVEQLEAALGHSDNAAWSASQATGQPDSPGTGDQGTAWAPSTQSSGNEWLELTYARRVTPSSILVHEVCSGGCLVKVTGFDYWGNEILLWKGVDPTKPNAGRGVSKIGVNTKKKLSRIRIYLDTKKASGWNEIDAVGVVDASGRTVWAETAKASSSYGSGQLPGFYMLNGLSR